MKTVSLHSLADQQPLSMHLLPALLPLPEILEYMIKFMVRFTEFRAC